MLPPAIQKALAIDPAAGSTFMDAEHIVLLMQENRSFDHTYGTLQEFAGLMIPGLSPFPIKTSFGCKPMMPVNTYAPFRFDIKGTM
jgi:phospholipase C